MYTIWVVWESDGCIEKVRSLGSFLTYELAHKYIVTHWDKYYAEHEYGVRRLDMFRHEETGGYFLCSFLIPERA